jgi:hypothetical protein
MLANVRYWRKAVIDQVMMLLRWTACADLVVIAISRPLLHQLRGRV